MHDFGGREEKSVKTEKGRMAWASSWFRTDALMIGDSSVRRHWIDSAPLQRTQPKKFPIILIAISKANPTDRSQNGFKHHRINLSNHWGSLVPRTAVIVGTWVAHLQDCRKESFNTLPNHFERKTSKILPSCNCKVKTPLNQLESDSTIGLHLLQNSNCAAQYHDRQFSILAKARTQFYLVELEAIFIKT